MNWTPNRSPQITKFYVGEVALSLGSKVILITNSHKKLLVFCLGNQTLYILVVTLNKKSRLGKSKGRYNYRVTEKSVTKRQKNDRKHFKIFKGV